MRVTERQKEIATGLITPVVLLFCLFLGEFVLSYNERQRFGLQRASDKEGLFYLDQQHHYLRWRPNLSMGRYTINAQGFYSPPVAMPKPDRVVRLAFVGSSITFDPYAGRVENTWTYLVTNHLNATLKGCELDYINAGIPGTSPNGHAATYEHALSAFAPDIIFFRGGDFANPLSKLAKEQGINFTGYRPSWWANKSTLIKLIEKNLYQLQQQRMALRGNKAIRFDEKGILADYPDVLKRFIDKAHSNGALPVLVSAYPRQRSSQTVQEQLLALGNTLLYRPNLRIEDHLRIHAIYREARAQIAEKLAIPNLDLKDVIPGDAKHFKSATHYTPAGSVVKAKALTNAILGDAQIMEFRNRKGCYR